MRPCARVLDGAATAVVTAFLIVCLPVVWAAPSAGAEPSPPATSPAATRAATQATRPAPAGQPLSPSALRLDASVYPEGVTDEAGYRRYLRARTQALREAAATAADPGEKIPLLLALANWKLARRTEPAASRLVLEIDRPRDRRVLGRVAESARQDLDAARQLLEQAAASRPSTRAADSATTRPAEPDDLRAWQDQCALLSTFAEVLTAVGQADDAERAGELVRIAVRLAPLLEDNRRGLASAARMWQGLLLRRAGRTEEALSVLPLAMGAPAVLPYDLASKLLRCELLVERSAFSVASLLALRMEDQCKTWVKEPGAAASARRAVILMRVRLDRTWADALARGGLEAEAADRRRAADALFHKTFPPDKPCGLFRLGEAVPIIAPHPLIR